jgi:hypothetical protein
MRKRKTNIQNVTSTQWITIICTLFLYIRKCTCTQECTFLLHLTLKHTVLPLLYMILGIRCLTLDIMLCTDPRLLTTDPRPHIITTTVSIISDTRKVAPLLTPHQTDHIHRHTMHSILNNLHHDRNTKYE